MEPESVADDPSQDNPVLIDDAVQDNPTSDSNPETETPIEETYKAAPPLLIPPSPKRRSVLVDRLSLISKNVLRKQKKHERKSSFSGDEFGDLPPPDYYYKVHANVGDHEDEEAEPLSYTPLGRNAVEMNSRFYVERNLFTYLTNATIFAELNYYDDDEVDLSCLTQKPIAVIILGKPGIGKTTLARRLARKLNAVHICPEEVIEYYRFQDILPRPKVNAILDAGGSISDIIVAQLVEARVAELDVLHRGYVLDGFPMVTSEELPIEEQVLTIENMPIAPQYAILLNMQDTDLFHRRTEQKLDPVTSNIFIRQHYSKFDSNAGVFNSKYKGHKQNKASSSSSDVANLLDVVSDSPPMTKGRVDNDEEEESEDDEILDGSRDFLPLDPTVIFRLITRTEDNPVLVNDDLEQFRSNVQSLQTYVERFDKRKVLELDAYWAPSALFRRTWEFLEAVGVKAVSIPAQIMRSLDLPIFKRTDPGEFLGEDDDSEAPCPDDEAPTEIDWNSAMRAVSVRGLEDPRFRWRISRWQNFCPVALKYGRSIIGKPELATSFLDKVFFMSSKEAVEQFVFNPRPYLLPKMPTSPVKFFVIGHPLAGKSSFAKELAFQTNAQVVDMNNEMEKRYSQVKNDYLYKRRLKYSLEAKIKVEREDRKEWRRQERARRAAMHKWIEDYLRGIAQAEIRAALDADRDRRIAERNAWRKEADAHKMNHPFYMNAGMCQRDESINTFCWASFVKAVESGRTTDWDHQDMLQLAWDLFHQKRLYYKRFKREAELKITMFGDVEEDAGEFGLVSDLLGEQSSEEEFLGEEEPGEIEDPGDKIRITKPRRRNKCYRRKIYIKPRESEENPVEPDEAKDDYESSAIDPSDDELEESILMRYPTIPVELVESIPAPTEVSDFHPTVQEIVNSNLAEDEKYVHSLPAELYIEVLRRACSEAEAKYHEDNSFGPLSGGWIVENLMTDIEKWRSILRTPEVCPDQVVVLQDSVENNYNNIYIRLKKIFKLNVSLPPTRKSRPKSLKKQREFQGEGGFNMELLGEDTGVEEDDDDDVASFPSNLNLDSMTADEFYRSILPLDHLTDPLEDTPSNLLQVMLDINRAKSPVTSDLLPNDLDNLLSSRDKFILEHVESKMSSHGSEVKSYESWNSDDLRRQLAAAYKSLNYEMSALIAEPESGLGALEQYKDELGVIKEYLRHSRELGNLSYAKEKAEEKETEEKLAEGTSKTLQVVIGEDGESENVMPMNDNLTPDELRSETNLLIGDPCPENLSVDEQKKCLREQQEQKIENPKRRFFMQIRLFNEFWNMAVPVCNEQGVKYWELGLIDENSAREKCLNLWDELEKRFELRAKKVSENELREEDEEIQESLMKYGKPHEHNNPRGLLLSASAAAENSFLNKADKKSKGLENESEDEDNSEFGEVSEDDLREDRDILAELEGKPDLYRKTVNKMEAQRCFGDVKFYCPVTLAEANILRKGVPQYACKFRERLYYCGNAENQQKFVQNPTAYLPLGHPKVPPPPRICITGSPGCGQEEVAVKISKEYNICFINFRQRMHELMKARLGKDIGPAVTGTVVSKWSSEKLISKVNSGDDMLQKDRISSSEIKGEGDFGNRGVSLEQNEDQTIAESALKSLGILDFANISTVPIGSIERTERLTERKWKKLTKMETYVQAFLENGIQLPEVALDEFVAPLWKEAPFDQVGFVLVGFPNTEADIKYLMKKELFPEYVYILECHPLAIRNRLIVPAVDRWHREHNPSGKRKTSTAFKYLPKAFKVKTLPGKGVATKTNKNTALKEFQYQTDGRPELDEFVAETWTYNDNISAKMTQALKHYHAIYTKGIVPMKLTLNRYGIDWMPMNTNSNLLESKRLLTEQLTSKLKHRSSIFEDTVRLNLKEANALLNKGVFEISKLQRWCPAELFSGNSAVNLWNAPGVEKIPIMYRRYIYFLAGEKNAKLFEQNCWQLISQETPMSTVPAVVSIMGPPRSGKTTLARHIADKLGLVYISGCEMIETILKHAFASQWANVLNDLEPAILADGPQPMMLAEEIINYLRNGQVVPRFLVYRALDLALMQPKAQYHGIVLDDYPITEEELQEILYRGVVPSTVIKLNINDTEADLRCERKRTRNYNYEYPPEEGHDAIKYITAVYEEAAETTMFWYQNEVQNFIEIDGTRNAFGIFETATKQIENNMKKMQQYLINVLLDKPSKLEGTCPLTSQLPLRLSPDFGFYCPVALNDRDELIRVAHITNLAEVVEYKGNVYVFSSSHNVKKFMNNPRKYIPPDCKRIPPKEVPVVCLLTCNQFQLLKDHWGFSDFDTVRYFDSNHHYKGLQRGFPKQCVAYRNKLYCFLNPENQAKFMKQPERYWNQLLPLKLPRRAEPIDMEKATWYNYLLAHDVFKEVRKVIQLTGEKRPKVPFMSTDKCASLFMGYYFKAQNMNAAYELRQKYRTAMFDMITTKAKTKKFLDDELKEYYGCRLKTLPERMKLSLDNFIKMETTKDGDKVLVPFIKDCVLSKTEFQIPNDEFEVVHQYEKIKELLYQAQVHQRMESFNEIAQRMEYEESVRPFSPNDMIQNSDRRRSRENKQPHDR